MLYNLYGTLSPVLYYLILQSVWRKDYMKAVTQNKVALYQGLASLIKLLSNSISVNEMYQGLTNFHISTVCSDLLWDIKPNAIIEPRGLCLIWFGSLSFSSYKGRLPTFQSNNYKEIIQWQGKKPPFSLKAFLHFLRKKKYRHTNTKEGKGGLGTFNYLQHVSQMFQTSFSMKQSNMKQRTGETYE